MTWCICRCSLQSMGSTVRTWLRSSQNTNHNYLKSGNDHCTHFSVHKLQMFKIVLKVDYSLSIVLSQDHSSATTNVFIRHNTGIYMVICSDNFRHESPGGNSVLCKDSAWVGQLWEQWWTDYKPVKAVCFIPIKQWLNKTSGIAFSILQLWQYCIAF